MPSGLHPGGWVGCVAKVFAGYMGFTIFAVLNVITGLDSEHIRAQRAACRLVAAFRESPKTREAASFLSHLESFIAIAETLCCRRSTL
eukprot:1655753-Amphidinium_carterae.3